MIKPALFRTALLAALPALANDPQNLSIAVERGHIRTNGEEKTGFEYVYTMCLMVQDFAGDFDQLAAFVMTWMRQYEPAALKNNQKNAQAVRFQVEILSTELVDVCIELDLTEATISGAQPGTWIHPPEPPADPSADFLFG
jgi:P2 phage tail completion protein R (GpR)